jgi:hypothetical protein
MASWAGNTPLTLKIWDEKKGAQMDVPLALEVDGAHLRQGPSSTPLGGESSQGIQRLSW